MAIKIQLGDNVNFASLSRARTVKILVYLMGIIFILRLAQLQLLKGSEYLSESQAQAIKKIKIDPFRGNMFDRYDSLIVYNETSFSLNLTPSEFRNETLPLLAQILVVDTTDILLAIKKNRQFSPYVPIKLYRDLSFQTVSQIEEYSDFLPGVSLSIESKRLYDFEGNMVHFLGYTGEVNQREIQKMSFLSQGDVIGKTGLEKEYEQILHGLEGVEYVEVNNRGVKVAKFDGGKKDLKARNGFDIKLTIDTQLQELAEKLLAGKRGAVVALDPSNGEILVLASKPDFDPRQFSGKISREYYNQLVNDEGKPFQNRAANSSYPPGSAWKMLIAAAGLNEGLITESTTLPCIGGYNYGDRFFKCMHYHGNINVVQAIQGSCNSFFYQLSLKLGLAKVIKYGQLFGFGNKTELDLPFEGKGNYPDVERLTKLYKGRVPKGLLLNYGIGQGEILATPIQMASYTTMLANGGKYVQPHIVRSIKNNITNKVEPINYVTKNLGIKPEVFKIIQKGMWAVVNTPGGTAFNSARIPGLDVCGKTSTAQNPHGKDHGWFVSFAPKENPKIAVAVIIENMGFGGVVAAPIAKEVINSFFNRNLLKRQISDTLLPQILTPIDTLSDIENTPQKLDEENESKPITN